MTTRFDDKTPAGWFIFIVLSTIVVFIIDSHTIIGVGVWLFYLAPLGASAFVSRPVVPLLVAAVSTVLIYFGYMMAPPGIAPWVEQLNRVLGLIVIWAFALQTRQVIISRLALQQRNWLRTSQMLLSEQVIGEHSLASLSERILHFLAGYLNAGVGALYVRNLQRVVRVAGFALPADHVARDGFAVGEGLVGQAVLSNRLVELTHIPQGYMKISSGLGDREPTTLLICPVGVDGEVLGVLELGFIQPAHPIELELLTLLAEPMGIAMRTAKLRSEREALLSETQRQAEELQAQQEELRVSNEELEQQSNVLRESQSRLETQQAELEQTNVQLEEHAQMLARQNAELDTARNEIVAKAAELERSNQFKSQFLANMSHELRTPLNSSLILAKLLGDNATGNLNEEQVKFARNIYSAGNELLELINDILDLSKIEARKVDIRRESVAIGQLIDGLVQAFGPMAEQKQVSFATAIDAAAPQSIDTDSQRLRQILKNLLSNALKFTAQGRVSLRAFVPEIPSQDEPWIAFAVEDTGIGIALSQQEIIFEPFRQADGTTNRRFGGTGLGLSISRELAALLGGHIDLRSVPGVGTTFTLLLPQSMPEQPHGEEPVESPEVRAATRIMASRQRAIHRQPLVVAPKPSNAAPPKPRPGRVLLVIEDDPAFADTLCGLATSLQYECLVASTADEGIELALQHQPMAIVLDIRLPDHTGLSVLDRIKHDPTTRHIPVQVISAFDYSQAALEMGAANVLVKPVDRDRLLGALSALERKVAHGERAVLIVEDNTIQRDSICQLLESESVRAVAVATAEAALEQLRARTFDCMVLDLALPDASGYELLKQMVSSDAYSFPPVIVYTARSLSVEEEQQLLRYSKSIIIKGAKSPERLLDEVTLFLHKVEASLPPEHQRMLRVARSRESVFNRRHILLVEDDVRNVFAITRVLEPHGAKLEIARNGREALDALEKLGTIELVLMDIMMPEMDGIEATRAIRRQPVIARVPIIALTAKAMPDDRQRCLDAGANDYITKPIDIDKLLSLMRIWLPPRTGLNA